MVRFSPIVLLSPRRGLLGGIAFCALKLAPIVLLSSCALLAHSPRIRQASEIPMLVEKRGLMTTPSGEIPYQRWRIEPWGDDMRYVWIVGSHDFRKVDNAELILYFHGMHSKDYYDCFKKELEELAVKRRSRPFLFIGFVDTPYADCKSRSENRWKSLAPKAGERPDRLLAAVNSVYAAFRRSFPQIKAKRTKLALTGFSGGGRVLSSVGQWLANGPKDDPYTKVFLGRLARIVYFDCWFEPNVVKIVPTLLESSPSMKIVGTVHMQKPEEHAAMLAGQFKMKQLRSQGELVGAGGRLRILKDKSHWDAMIARLTQALEG
jgi:hypothetical protein